MPFREAHHVTGRAVAAAAEKGIALDKLPIEALQAIDARITAEVYDVLTVERSVKSRTSYGGTAPQNVRRAARTWLKRLAKEAAAKERPGRPARPERRVGDCHGGPFRLMW